MGLFGNLFSGGVPDYPQLDEQSPAGQKIAAVEQELAELVHKVSQPLEVVPTDHAAYVFIGNPPKKFGLAWIHDGEVSGLNALIKEHGVTPAEIEKVLESLREAYSRNQDAQHYTATVDQRKLVVTASETLEQEVHEIIEEILH